MTLILTDENFEKEILTSPKPVLVDFWMFNCAPCSLISPILGRISNDFEEKLILAKVNLDTAPLTAQKYGITMAPTIILFKEGKLISGFIGIRPESDVREWLKDNLGNEKDEVEKVIQEVKEDKSSSPPSLSLREISVYEEYAKKNGFSLNPNKKIVEGIVKSLLEREKKFGARYCPCRRITGNPEDDKKIICPCIFHREEIEKDGHCLCRLFVK